MFVCFFYRIPERHLFFIKGTVQDKKQDGFDTGIPGGYRCFPGKRVGSCYGQIFFLMEKRSAYDVRRIKIIGRDQNIIPAAAQENFFFEGHGVIVIAQLFIDYGEFWNAVPHRSLITETEAALNACEVHGHRGHVETEQLGFRNLWEENE